MSTSSNLFFPAKNRDSLNYPAPVLAAPHLYAVIFSAVMMMPVGLPILSSHFNTHSKDGCAVLNNCDFSAENCSEDLPGFTLLRQRAI